LAEHAELELERMMLDDASKQVGGNVRNVRRSEEDRGQRGRERERKDKVLVHALRKDKVLVHALRKDKVLVHA
jgi:hypothetical protein